MRPARPSASRASADRTACAIPACVTPCACGAPRGLRSTNRRHPNWSTGLLHVPPAGSRPPPSRRHIEGADARMRRQSSCASRARRRACTASTMTSASPPPNNGNTGTSAPPLAERSVEPAAGKHADQRRDQSPHDDARAGAGSSFGHCSVSRCSSAPPILRQRPRAVQAAEQRSSHIRGAALAEMLSDRLQRVRQGIARRPVDDPARKGRQPLSTCTQRQTRFPTTVRYPGHGLQTGKREREP